MASIAQAPPDDSVMSPPTASLLSDVAMVEHLSPANQGTSKDPSQARLQGNGSTVEAPPDHPIMSSPVVSLSDDVDTMKHLSHNGLGHTKELSNKELRGLSVNPMSSLSHLDNDTLQPSTLIATHPRMRLGQLDKQLLEALRQGDILLLKASYIRTAPAGYRIRRRQDLQRDNAAAFYTPEQAVALIERGDRSVGTLTYGWLSPGDPDPDGHRFELLRQALEQHPLIVGLFWDYASLYQVHRRPLPPLSRSSLTSRLLFPCALSFFDCSIRPVAPGLLPRTPRSSVLSA